MEWCFVLLRLKKVPIPQYKRLRVKFECVLSILTWLIEMRNIDLGLQLSVRLWYLKNLKLVFPWKLSSCIVCFSLFLDELGLTENRGAKKKGLGFSQDLGIAQVLGEAEASFLFF